VWVLDAYRPLLESGRFYELPKRPGASTNDFSVRIGNSSVVIEVEGIGYGAGAWLKVFRPTDADTDRYGLPILHLLALRNPERKGRRKRSEGQMADIKRDAANLLQYAQDVLAGDLAALDAVARQLQEQEKQRLARLPSPEQQAADVAFSEAGHAFKHGDYRRVVELLGPHVPLLTDSQKRRYKLARERMGR